MWIEVFVFIFICHASVSSEKISCDFRNTVNISSGFVDEHGNFNHDGIVYKKGFFAEFDYIFDKGDTTVQVNPHVRGCVCEYRPCIRVCCRQNSKVKGSCLKNDLFYVFVEDEVQKPIDLVANQYGILEGIPCKESYFLEDDVEEDKWILSDGQINLVNHGKTYDRNNYCFGQQSDEDGNLTTTVSLCVQEEEKTQSIGLRPLLYTIGMIFSLPFLLITFCVYGFIPELRNVHGKSLMCYVFALMVMYIGWCIIHLESGDSFYAGSFPCVFVGYMVFISVYICFFWLNIMCFDIFNTFRGGLKSRGGDKKKFLYYCLYAFGVPLLITIIVFLFDNLNFFSEDYQPQIGYKKCWVQHEKLVEAIYVYIPISIIIGANIAFYSITAHKIFKVQKETSVIRNEDSRRHGRNDAEKDRFFLYLRLFIVMGATWSMESLSWLLNNRFYLFYIGDVLNSLQGFIIFILFVWKPKVRDLIRQRLFCHYGPDSIDEKLPTVPSPANRLIAN